MQESAADIAQRLTRLGFSQYEARTYVGLLMSGGATGYALANDTGVPQPKVYETLRRLVDRGAARLTGEQPARYAAVPPAELLKALEHEFATRVKAAREGLDQLPVQRASERALPLSRTDTFSTAGDQASAAIGDAHSRVYLSGWTDELKALAAAVDQASDRGVHFVIVHFGRLPFRRPLGKVMRHASTEGTLYQSRKARHLAVVVDSRWSLWAAARDGRTWEGVYGEMPLLSGLVKSFIRHDLFVQRMFADLPAELEALYGPGLLELTNLSGGSADEAGSDADAPAAGAVSAS